MLIHHRAFSLSWNSVAYPLMLYSHRARDVMIPTMKPAPTLRCAGIAMVRNEADIIECWARYNLRVLDCLHITDHHSQDNTVEILESLRSEGLPIYLYRFEHQEHQ
jgi:hypothetical protein